MKEVLIGLTSGIVSGTGMGGGTVLILLLTMILGIEQHIAQATNLIFFIPTSIVAIITNWKHKLIDTKMSVVISICGIIGAIFGAIISNKTDVKNLRRYFGIFLAVIAIFEIYSYFRKYIFTSGRNTIKKER
ncbi:MAG: sulfite exporter TauE/SafE family protein [Clostridia bacterium]|nr:sulfite exporter TauE/SafE family protein [Clostridia bacterium]